MSPLQFVALMLAVVRPLLALAQLVRLPATLTLFGIGLASVLRPGLPVVRVDPQLLTVVFLPIHHASTARITWHLLHHP
jgi:hypothetical protein